MFSFFLSILGTWVVLAGMSEAGIFERSDLSPLSIVYTLYPYYNSETLLEVLKAEEEPLRVNGNVEPAPSREAESGDATAARGGDGPSDAPEVAARQESNDRRSSRNDSNGSVSHRASQQLTEITYWPPVQRGAAPKLRLGRASDLLRQTDI